MNKNVLSFIITLLCINTAWAQQDFRSGYLITHQNDTIKGLIDYRGKNRNAKVCDFREEGNASITSYAPSDIKGFRYTGSKYYVSREVAVGEVKELLFLEFLINGIVDIYYYYDSQGDHYFIEKEGGDLYALETIEKEVLVDGKPYMQTDKRYIGLLKSLLYESPELYPTLDYLNLSHKSLIKMAKTYHYNVCAEEDPDCIIYEKKLPGIKVSIGPLAGIHFFSIAGIKKTFTDDHYYFRNSDFNTATYPSFGFFVNINMPYINERFSVQYEATFDKQTFSTSNYYPDPVYNMHYYNALVVSQSFFNNALLLRYEVPTGNFKPVVQLGPFVNYNFKPVFSRELEIQYASGETYHTEEMDDSPLPNFNLGITGGIGAAYYLKNQRMIQCNLKYARGLGLSDYFLTNQVSLDIGFTVF